MSLAKSVVFSPDSCEACLQYHERRANVVQKPSLPRWHQSILWSACLHTLQIYLKTLQAAQISLSLERNSTVNTFALAWTALQNFETLQKIILSPKPIIRSWYCILFTKIQPFVCIGLSRCHYSIFSKNFIHLIFHLSKKKKGKKIEIKKCFF